MGFKCGIIGLPNVGKSTLFNALTESMNAEAANYPFATINPNIGRVAVPDKRLDKIGEIGKSEKIIPAYMDFVDIAGLVKGASNGEGLGNKFLAHIREVDAIAHVVRCFKDDNITHVSSTINPINDIETVTTELQLADIEILQSKQASLEKKSKQGNRDIKHNLFLIEQMLKNLSLEYQFEKNQFKADDLAFLNSLNLISLKPFLYICNVDEKSIIHGNSLSKLVQEKAKKNNHDSVIISALIESQFIELENDNDRIELLKELGINDTTLKKVIIAGYNLLDLINFFTCVPKETRSWTIKKNTLAPQAAGKIHSDFEKGFIRAETLSYEDFVFYKGYPEAKNYGKLRLEGKDYIVQDGDVLLFRFNT